MPSESVYGNSWNVFSKHPFYGRLTAFLDRRYFLRRIAANDPEVRIGPAGLVDLST
jgi:hypothetical protein